MFIDISWDFTLNISSKISRSFHLLADVSQGIVHGRVAPSHDPGRCSLVRKWFHRWWKVTFLEFVELIFEKKKRLLIEVDEWHKAFFFATSNSICWSYQDRGYSPLNSSSACSPQIADQQLISARGFLPSISSFERREWMSRSRARSWAIKPNGLIGANLTTAQTRELNTPTGHQGPKSWKQWWTIHV